MRAFLPAALIPLTFACQVAGSGPQSAQAVVEGLQSALLASLTLDREEGYEARYELLSPVVTGTHDFDTISRLILGRRHWKGLEPQQRAVFVDTFTELSIATYADKFSGGSDERFVFLGEEKTARGNRLVRTALNKSDGERVQLDYVLKQRDGQWRIINVIADGVSDLALKRSEYAQVLDDQGFEALIASLNEKIALASK